MPVLTLADLSARIYARLDNNTQLYPQSDVTDAINESIRVLNLHSGYNQVSVPLLSVADRLFYDTPSSVLIPFRISFEGKYLEPTSIDSIGQSFRNWTQATTANTGTPVSLWVKFGLRKFAIWPADSNGGGQILVTGVAEPTPLVNSTDSVNWSNGLLSAFDAYAVHVLQIRESPQTFLQASQDYATFQKMMRQLTIWRGLQQPMYSIEARQ